MNWRTQQKTPPASAGTEGLRDEWGWLIELPMEQSDKDWPNLPRRSSPQWLSVKENLGIFLWTYDSREALRFARKKDAQDFLNLYTGLGRLLLSPFSFHALLCRR